MKQVEKSMFKQKSRFSISGCIITCPCHVQILRASFPPIGKKIYTVCALCFMSNYVKMAALPWGSFAGI